MKVFDNYTDDAKNVVKRAIFVARELDHDFLGTEHFLLALIRQGDPATAGVLAEMDVTEESVMKYVIDKVGKGDCTPVERQTLKYTSRAKVALSKATTESLRLGRYKEGVTPACILLSLVEQAIRQGAGLGVAAGAIRSQGVDFVVLRERITECVTASVTSP